MKDTSVSQEAEQPEAIKSARGTSEKKMFVRTWEMEEGFLISSSEIKSLGLF